MSNPPLVFKNSAKGWVYDGDAGTLTQITDVDYPSNQADGAAKTVSSLTQTGGVATAVTLAAHGYTNGRTVTIAGASPAGYNGTVVITYVDTTTFTYTVSGALASPAIGTITSQLLKQTVPGIVVIDGTYYVMTPDGTIYGSDIELPLVWNALNYITAEVEFDGGVAIAKYLNYLIAFGTWSTEFFYDAANATGSPLSRADNIYVPVGCADARSIAQGALSVVWMAQSKEGSSGASAGRSIRMLEAFQHKTLSTPFVERIINADNLNSVRSFIFTLAGHMMYVITLVSSAVSLVYDFKSGLWYKWTGTTTGVAQTVTTVTNDGTLATVTLAAHEYADGDVVVMAGAAQAGYNGTFNITYVDANTFTYTLAAAAATPATGIITATGFTESYLPFMFHATAANANLFIDQSNGYVYQLTDIAYNDNGAYIDFIVRTPKIDLGHNLEKRIARLDIIGDKAAGSAMVRYSKNDYQTHSTYRKVDLNLDRSGLTRIGMARRLSLDVRVTDAIPVRLERLDATLEGGE